MSKKISSKLYKNEDWIREHIDENLDWHTISSNIPKWFNINFCRQFENKISWLWLIYASGIEQREDLINEFSLNDKLHEIYSEADDV